MTRPFGNLEKAKVLVIGHDPKLINSPILTDYALFADYYFKPVPTKLNEKAKYDLAKSLFAYIFLLTNQKHHGDELYITNLCNSPLPSVKGKIVFIPEDKAQAGLKEIKDILSKSKIELIFAMSEQVNYWLQKLGFYNSYDSFLQKSAPKKRGIEAKGKFYEHTESKAFSLICCKQFIADNKYKLIPILHVKNWPLKGNFKEAY